MSLSNGPAETSGQPPRPAAAGEPSPFAPRWARDGWSQRKVVPLHLPAAPQLVPASPVETDAAPVAPRVPRPSGPELLAEDAVLKRLLQRSPPDPQPLAAKPVRDPVGLALGMVARLIVAGCAAAAVIMLLLGILPLPFRFGPVAASDVTPVATVSTTADAVVPQRVADAGTSTALASPSPASTPAASTAGAGGDADAVVPATARVATVSVRAAPASATEEWALDPGEV